MAHDIRIKLRTEFWKPGPGAVCGLLLIARSDTCLALLLRRDPDTRLWTYGIGRFPMEAFLSSRMGFVDCLDATMDPRPMLNALGLYHEIPARLVEVLMGPWLHGSSRINHEAILHAGIERLTGIGFTPMASEGSVMGKFADAPWQPAPPVSTQTIRRDRTFAFDAQAASHEIAGTTDATTTVEGEALFGLTRFVEAWYRRMVPALYPNDMRFLNASHWTTALHAHHTHPGTVGEYRRQAGTIYPLLAPLLAHDPETVALIDAGKPYERRVCEVLNGLGMVGRDDGFSVAKLRRLRGVRSRPNMTWVHDFLRLVAILPVDRLHLLTRAIPGLPTGYIDCAQMLEWSTTLGLEFIRITDRLPEGPVLASLRDAEDMARRCAETLVAPILGGGAIPRLMIAGILLFEGLDLAGVDALSRRWHARMESFENALPEGRDLVTWPALFAPFEHEGIRIACLTVQSQLRAEGSSVRDRDGVMGLGHCVGGYGLQCYVGASHVASVRRGKGGTWERVSTLEIDMGDGPRPVVAQHRGALNADPPEYAIRAVNALVDGLARGAVPMDPEAMTLRSGDGFQDGVRWTEAGSILRSWQAWRPYLPKRVAGRDLDGFERYLFEIHGDCREYVASRGGSSI